MKPLLFVLFSLFIATSAFCETFVSGEVRGEWTRGGNPYIAVGDLFLTSNDTLVIRAGVIVKFESGREFTLSGHFECLGEAGDSVYFTQDTTDFDDRWLGLSFHGTNPADTSIVRYSVIENAGTYSGALSVHTSYLLFEHNTVRNCLGIGVRIENQTAELRDCSIINNSGEGCGGGILTHRSDVTFRRCLIADNSAMDGGGICSFVGSVTFDACTLSRNSGSIWAGAIFADSVNVTLTNCLFDSNYATDGGAGWIANDCRARIDRCVFKENFAIRSDGQLGSHGALLMYSPGPQHVTNCLFIGNRGNNGSAMNVMGNTWIFNCAFVGNSSFPAIYGDVDTLRHCSFDSRQLRNNATGPQGFGRLSAVNVNGDSVDVFGNLYALADFDSTGPYGEYSLARTSHWINAGDANGPPDEDGTLPDIGPFPFYIVGQVTDLTIERIAESNSLRLHWSPIETATEYWVFRTNGGEFRIDEAFLVGVTPSDEFVDLDAVIDPIAQRTYVVISVRVPPEIVLP